MLEIMIVIVIISILTAILVPTTMHFIDRGHQINRMNIARTIYLAAQNQLTKNFTEGNLREILTDHFYGGGALDADAFNDVNRVFGELGGFPADGGFFPDEEDPELIRFVSIPAGARTAALTPLERDFFQFLDAIIIDNEILESPILMEFNIVTGVILSVFYGDNGQNRFIYSNAAVDDDNINNVFGGRSEENGYARARDRRQGYFGALTTGDAQQGLLDENLREIVNIYDGMLDANGNLANSDALRARTFGADVDKVNVLYAEFILPRADAGGDYRISLVGGAGNEEFGFDFDIRNAAAYIDLGSPDPIALNGFDRVLSGVDGVSIYSDNANPVTAAEAEQLGLGIVDLAVVNNMYQRYIWIIDYIGNDDANNYWVLSIAEKVSHPQYVRARLSLDGRTVTSRTRAHSHFARELAGAGSYEIRSARHLNNIRYSPDSAYRQTIDIDMERPGNVINAFVPIGLIFDDGRYEDLDFGPNSPTDPLYRVLPFTGQYTALRTASVQNLIHGLTIATGLSGDVGLFSEIDGGTVRGIGLFEAQIFAEGANNVGAIAGRLAGGGTISQSFAFASVRGGGNTGGLVGHIANGLLEDSFNAGFSNATGAAPGSTESRRGTGSVLAPAGNVGGLVGLNDVNGTVRSSFNNARVNIVDVDVVSFLSQRRQGAPNPPDDPNGDGFFPLTGALNLGGIVGRNSGVINGTYATNNIPFYGSDANCGGIAGISTVNLWNNFFIANGILLDNLFVADGLPLETLPGTATLPKALLAVTLPSPRFETSAMTGGAANHSYTDQYPYPDRKSVV
jgi:hypothetical protein